MDKEHSDKKSKTTADKIWEEIKGKKIEMFALPDQVVEQYLTPFNLEPSKLYLVPSASAALPALELALGNKYLVEMLDRLIVVSYAQPPLTKK